MRRYQFLHHTADAKFRAFGSTLEEAFRNAALATASLMWDWRKINVRIEHQIEVEGRDLKQLLANFLEEIVYLFESKKFLLAAVDNIIFKKRGDKYRLKARFKGDKYKDSYNIHGDVKAITYNEMEILNNDHFTLQVVVDI
ncbi:MAG: archease [Candidatus Aminicenantales bacterium]